MASLLSLPFELRLRILEYAIVDKELLVCLDRKCIIHHCFGPFKPINRNAKLLMICIQINKELRLCVMPKLKLYCCSATTARQYMKIYRPRLDSLEYLRLPAGAFWYDEQGAEDRVMRKSSCASSAPELLSLSLVEVEELPSDHLGRVEFALRYEPLDGVKLGSGAPRRSHTDTTNMHTLMELPSEIRLIVLRYAIPQELAIEVRKASRESEVWCSGSPCKNPALPSLLVCRQLSVESSAIPSTIAIMKFSAFTDLRNCIMTCSARFLRCVDEIWLQEDFDTGFLSLTQATEAQFALANRQMVWRAGDHLRQRFIKVVEKEYMFTWTEKERATPCTYAIHQSIVWQVSGSTE